MRRILVVDDEENLRHMLQILLRRQGYEVVGAPTVDGALKEIAQRPYDVVLADLRMPGKGAFDLLAQLKQQELETTVIVMSAYGSQDVAISAIKEGAYDYISKPFESDEILFLLRKVEERERLLRENQTLKQQLTARGDDVETGLGDMVGQSAAMARLFRTIRKIAEFKTTVLLQGESGTGKELVARALHRLSPRSEQPFVAVNCGAIPANLLESELFGHRKGAFTDASRDRKGLFEEASEGTLFLDEIGELPLNLQVKLLRVLQEEEIRRLGDDKDIQVNVRVVAATARDLTEEVRLGRFREDLFYRLNVLTLHLPALRERREDIPLLVDHFVTRMKARMPVTVQTVADEAMRALVAYGWPGNVRELENTMERALVLTEGTEVGLTDLPEKVQESRKKPVSLSDLSSDPRAGPLSDLSIKRASRRAEEALIRQALTRTGGNRTHAAELLEISHRALLYKIKEYAISFPRSAPGARADHGGTDDDV